MSVAFQQKFSTGLFGGEGFIMQKLTGQGRAFLEIDGSAVEYELSAGERIIVDTGYLAMMDASCTMDVQAIRGVKNVLLGHLSGENNTPELAYASALAALQTAGVEPGSVALRVLRRGVSSPLLNL